MLILEAIAKIFIFSGFGLIFIGFILFILSEVL